MYILFFVLPAIFMILVGIYLYFYLKRMAGFFKINIEKRWIRIILKLCSIVLTIFALNIWGIWAVILLHIFAFALCMDLLYFILKKLSSAEKNQNKSVTFRKIWQSGLIPVFCTIMLLGYGYWNMRHIVEQDYTIYTEKNIRDEGYRIAMLSDLHYGTTIGAERLKEICKEIEDVKPDMVILCGDIVDERTSLSQLNELMPILGSIQSSYGSFYVYGNHDQALYYQESDYTVIQLQEAIQSAGIAALRDESYHISEDLTLIGRDDPSFPVEANRRNSDELLKGIDTNDFLVVLDHRPVELVENSKAGYDLQLSGHTHAGQIWPVGLISDILGFGELNYGYRKIDDFQIIVSSGIAGWGYPLRTGSQSEFIIVDIKKSL